MTNLRVHLEGIGVWSPAWADFAALRAWLAYAPTTMSNAKPPAAPLPASERRRAPESVLIAIEVAAQAVAMSGRAMDTLACVFASTYGDQAITDYMCATLAHAPAELSPTRFHHSVHNAPAGYWTIAADCRAPSSAVCAGAASFGAGLLEAAVQVCADARPVLLVCSDIGGSGPLGALTGDRREFGCALLLSPEHGSHSLAQLDLQPTSAALAGPPLPADAAEWIAHNPSAAALPLLALLAREGGDCVLATPEHLALHVHLHKETTA